MRKWRLDDGCLRRRRHLAMAVIVCGRCEHDAEHLCSEPPRSQPARSARLWEQNFGPERRRTTACGTDLDLGLEQDLGARARRVCSILMNALLNGMENAHSVRTRLLVLDSSWRYSFSWRTTDALLPAVPVRHPRLHQRDSGASCDTVHSRASLRVRAAS